MNMEIRNATIHDLDDITELERCCFPIKEAAAKEDFLKRLQKYPNHFRLLESDGKIISMVNGMVTDQKDLTDEMYCRAELHKEDGDWQMIFGVDTHPDFRKKGYAAVLLKEFIESARREKRKGLVLTCKEGLIPYYAKFGFLNEGISESVHGNVVWYQMRLSFDEDINDGTAT